MQELSGLINPPAQARRLERAPVAQWWRAILFLEEAAEEFLSFGKTGNAFAVTLDANARPDYSLQRPDPPSGPWQSIGVARHGEDACTTLTDPDGADGGRRFYRVSISP